MMLITLVIAVIAVVLASCLPTSQRSAADRWKHRFGAIGSPLIEPPPYRVLFLLVVLGVLLISVLPEAAFVLPALDAVGLDIVTILVALELRHYVASVARLVGVPTGVAVCRRLPAQVVGRSRDVMRTNPVLWLYTCTWAMIWFRAFLAKDLPRPKM
jgi:hypothetical protein